MRNTGEPEVLPKLPGHQTTSLADLPQLPGHQTTSLWDRDPFGTKLPGHDSTQYVERIVRGRLSRRRRVQA